MLVAFQQAFSWIEATVYVDLTKKDADWIYRPLQAVFTFMLNLMFFSFN